MAREAGTRSVQWPENISQVGTVVLQCVEALEQLHAMLKNERERAATR